MELVDNCDKAISKGIIRRISPRQPPFSWRFHFDRIETQKTGDVARGSLRIDVRYKHNSSSHQFLTLWDIVHLAEARVANDTYNSITEVRI